MVIPMTKRPKWKGRKVGDRKNIKLLRRMHELLLEQGPMTAKALSDALQTRHPNRKRFHHNSIVLSQLMVGRPALFEKVTESPRGCEWGAVWEGSE